MLSIDYEYSYPHPLQSGWEALMKSVADSGKATKASAGNP